MESMMAVCVIDNQIDCTIYNIEQDLPDTTSLQKLAFSIIDSKAVERQTLLGHFRNRQDIDFPFRYHSKRRNTRNSGAAQATRYNTNTTT